MDTDTTNPVEAGDTSEEETAAETQEVETEGTEEQEPELDEDGNPIEPEDDSEEVEHEGQKYKVPKALKPLMLMQADYTRKTQEVAEQRKGLEAERQAFEQISNAELTAHAHMTALAQQIAAYNNVDWDRWEDEDPFAAQKGLRQLQQLKDAHQMAGFNFNNARQQRVSAAQQETARRVEQAAGVLREKIGWDDKKAADVLSGGVREFGFDRSEIEELSDARMVLVLHDALQWRAHQARTSKAQNHVKAQATQPAAKAGGSTPIPANKLDDRLSTAEWLRRRNKQVAAKNGR